MAIRIAIHLMLNRTDCKNDKMIILTMLIKMACAGPHGHLASRTTFTDPICLGVGGKGTPGDNEQV